MRFALLGDHVDGLDMARALMQSGRHELTVYSGPKSGLDSLARWGARPTLVGDLEEILADPLVEAVVVAGGPAARANQLRRALQSQRHVLCVHPAGESPDLAYEAGMIQGDVRCALLPLLPEALHPGIRRLAELAHAMPSTAITPHILSENFAADLQAAAPLPGEVKLLEIERWSTEEVLLQAEAHASASNRPLHAAVAGWDTLRLLGGDVSELSVLSATEELGPTAVILLSGQFVRGGLFQQTLLPCQAENRLRLALVTGSGRAELVFSQGWPGPAELTYRDSDGNLQTQTWPAIDPWPGLVLCFEAEVARWTKGSKETASVAGPQTGARLGWQDEIRAAELDDAARRSLRRHRSSTLEYQEGVEEASFKGAMTLLGCGLLLVSLLLLILSAWAPWLGWLILPAIGIFLLMQTLRLAVKPDEPRQDGDGTPS